MKLPGGYLASVTSVSDQQGNPLQAPLCTARLQNEFRFKPRCGALQLLLQERRQYCIDNQLSHAHWVSELLACILVQMGDYTATHQPDDEAQLLSRVRQLCVADRQFILWQWRLNQGHVQGNQTEWLSNQCPACDAYYDFPLDWQMLPIKLATVDFPFAQLTLGSQQISARVPNGGDQEFIADWLSNHPAATQRELQRTLLRRLLIVDEKTDVAELEQMLSDEQIASIESALEAVAPELASAIQLACPECGFEHQLQLDLYQQLLAPINQLLDEVHQLAIHYHWREEDILHLPETRRRAYLQRLELSQGMRGAV